MYVLQKFALHHGNELTGGRDVYLRCEVSMDGAPTTSIYSPMGHEWCRDGQRIDPTTRLAFQFAPLVTTGTFSVFLVPVGPAAVANL